MLAIPNRAFTFKGRVPIDRQLVLTTSVIHAFGVEADTETMLTQLRGKPQPLDDIGQRIETWNFGVAPEVKITRVSDWDWHDLRGIYLTSQQLRIEAGALQPGHEFQLSIECELLDLRLVLAEPLFNSVMEALCNSFGWTREDAELLSLLPALGDAWGIRNLAREVALQRSLFIPVAVPGEVFAALANAISQADGNREQSAIYEHLGLLLRCAAERYDEALTRIQELRRTRIPVKQLPTFEGWCLMQKRDFRGSRAALQRECYYSPACQWMMLEALIGMRNWKTFIACAEGSSGKQRGSEGVLEDYQACLLQAEALCRIHKPQRAILRLKRAVCLDPFGHPLEPLAHSIPQDFDLLIRKLGPMFGPLRELPDFAVLASQPFQSANGFAKNPRLIAALCEIPPFTDDWDPEAAFEIIDLDRGENSRKELEAALAAIRKEGLEAWRPPWLALRAAMILGKLRRVSEARSLVGDVLKNHPRNSTARKLDAALRQKDPAAAPRKKVASKPADKPKWKNDDVKIPIRSRSARELFRDLVKCHAQLFEPFGDEAAGLKWGEETSTKDGRIVGNGRVVVEQTTSIGCANDELSFGFDVRAHLVDGVLSSEVFYFKLFKSSRVIGFHVSGEEKPGEPICVLTLHRAFITEGQAVGLWRALRTALV